MGEPDLMTLTDLCTPWCVHVAATLRLVEHIDAGATGIDDLSAAAGCDTHMLHALLTQLVSKGVFTCPAPGQFAVNDAARQLDNPFLRLDGIGGRMAAAGTSGTVLVCGGVAPDAEPPVMAIDMVVAGGRTVTLSRFRDLAASAGLTVAAAGQAPAGYVVECRPPGT